MRQVLFSNAKAIVARMPRPTPAAGTVLVKTHYSLISAGTELATLRPFTAGTGGATAAERVSDITSRAQVYLGKAIRNPRLAADRVMGIVGNAIRQRVRDITPATEAASVPVGSIAWQNQAAKECAQTDLGMTLASGGEPGHYQAASQPLTVPGAGYLVEVNLKGRVESGSFSIGLLNADKSAWLGMVPLSEGPLNEVLHFDPGTAREITLMLTNGAAPGENRLLLEQTEITMVPAMAAGVPVTEMTAQGWNVGYSAAGEVVAIGPGVTQFTVGDRVACAGAGQANHADYIAVKTNLVCRVPDGCSLQEASTSTVGSIAMQGVRRASPQLAEVICVIGLGLIGMITVQLLRANGCRVIGLDLDAERCKRALTLGASAAESDAETIKRLVRDLTGGHGADATIITAASKSNAPLNTAMELTRRRGRVVIVGDIGLKAERAAFYRKEIDLLMSTSYGPGRYDRDYEDFGRDYPLAYVRWTANRNMQSYMELIAGKQIDVASLIDRVVPVDEAPGTYSELAASMKSPPLAVLISYPEPARVLTDAPDAPVIHLRGHRRPLRDQINYALVGAGGFGTQMLVPMLEKLKERFHLRGVVSRDPVRGGNFARSKQVEILSSSYDDILSDEGFDLVVLATRHDEHADQVVKALRSGKHVFVEKPLAITWEQLDHVQQALEAQPDGPRLMVGFNRRFSPAVQRLKQELGEQRTPLVVNYRLNAGYIPLDHWVHGVDGGGRNIGEACHMYDVFAYLADAPVASISAAAIDPGSKPYARNDNFCATIRYDDGSVCTLTYTALGPKAGLPKERIEVFGNGEAWIVDDFKSLTRASDGSVLWSSSTADKGHFEEMRRLGDCLAEGSASPIPVRQLLETTAVSLHVEDLLFGREGGN
jgi:predicted dehydrogenase/threonine dehydrogenase-like Zn-dependent dehydrogenase